MIHITICGHDSHHPTDFIMEHSKGLPDYLLLLVKTDAWFDLDGQRTPTQPNMAILFDRGAHIRYGCDHANYNDDWIHFDFESEEENILQKELNIPFGQPLYLTQLHTLSHYVQQMASVFRTNGIHRASLLDSIMRTLLYSMDEQVCSVRTMGLPDKYYNAFLDLRTQLYNNPGDDWTISGMAASLFLSASYYQHLYKQFFHCSCQQDIIRARLELAKFHLTSSDFGIASLAKFCGYQNELHFMRQFKKFEGMTPSQYREAQRSRQTFQGSAKPERMSR